MSGKEGSTFTARDFELLTGAFKCLKSEPIVDYGKYATRLGFKNSASAKASWHALKKKLDKLEAAGAHLSPSLTVDESSTSNKRAADDGGEDAGSGNDDNDDEVDVKPPTKKGKKAPSEKKAAKGRGKKAAVVDPKADAGEAAAEDRE